MIIIRGEEEFQPIYDLSGKSFVSEMLRPIGNIYSNWTEMQDFQHDYLLEYANDWTGGKLEVIDFEYRPGENEQRAALSLRLTNKEKRDIINSVTNIYNQSGMERLKEILK